MTDSKKTMDVERIDDLDLPIIGIYRTHKAICRICGLLTYVNGRMKQVVGRTGICFDCKDLVCSDASIRHVRWITKRKREEIDLFVNDIMEISKLSPVAAICSAYM